MQDLSSIIVYVLGDRVVFVAPLISPTPQIMEHSLANAAAARLQGRFIDFSHNEN